MHSIFKIGISRNMKCAYMVGFLKYSHICKFIYKNLRYIKQTMVEVVSEQNLNS